MRSQGIAKLELVLLTSALRAVTGLAGPAHAADAGGRL